MRIAIMQPTYLPWIGYFGLMKSVDIFVFLDSVQFAKRSWQQRNRIKTNNGPAWLTVPVFSKGKQNQLISEVEIDHNRKFPNNHINMIKASYGKSRFFNSYASDFFDILHSHHEKLVKLNIDLIRFLREKLGIETPIRCASEFGYSGSKASLLAQICTSLDATEYLSPPGSKDYLEVSDSFEKRNISVFYFNYEHPEYHQRFDAFVPYMSVVDLLFNEGDRSLSIISKGLPNLLP